jgi:hypothetical protein
VLVRFHVGDDEEAGVHDPGHAAAVRESRQLRDLSLGRREVAGSKAESAGSRSTPASPSAIFDGNRVVGVQVQDRGIDKDGKPKGVFEPGPRSTPSAWCSARARAARARRPIDRQARPRGPNPQAYETASGDLAHQAREPRARASCTRWAGRRTRPRSAAAGSTT